HEHHNPPAPPSFPTRRSSDLQQLDAAGNTLSSITAAGTFDQGAADGKGHLFVASNSGNLLFIDYDATGLIGAASNFTSNQFLAGDRKSTRLNSSHGSISYAVF